MRCLSEGRRKMGAALSDGLCLGREENRPLHIYKRPHRCSQHVGEAGGGGGRWGRDDAHGLCGQDFWARGPGPRSQQDCSSVYRTHALDQELPWGPRQKSSLPPAMAGKAFRAQPHTKHLTYGAALALTTSSEAGAILHSRCIDGQGEAQRG